MLAWLDLQGEFLNSVSGIIQSRAPLGLQLDGFRHGLTSMPLAPRKKYRSISAHLITATGCASPLCILPLAYVFLLEIRDRCCFVTCERKTEVENKHTEAKVTVL